MGSFPVDPFCHLQVISQELQQMRMRHWQNKQNELARGDTAPSRPLIFTQNISPFLIS